MTDLAKELDGKVAVVTGGSTGIGRDIALELAARGAAVVVADVDERGGAETVAAAAALGSRSVFIRTDVTTQAATDAMSAEVTRKFGGTDILINNAGVWGAGGWWEREQITSADWDRVFSVNVFGIVHATKSVEAAMLQRHRGKIVNIASVAGRVGSGGSAHYSASKAAAINLTQAFAFRLAKSGINVNAVAPGAIWSDLTEHAMTRLAKVRPEMGKTPREVFDRIVRERIPLGREQTGKDVALAAAFLVSERARSITGQTLNVTGGWQMN